MRQFSNGVKIAIVCKNLSFITGAPRLIFGMASHLRELGEEIVIYAADAPGDHFREIARSLSVRVVTPRLSSHRNTRKGFWGVAAEKVREERDEIAWAQAVAATMDADFDVVNVHDLVHRVGYFYKKRNPRTKVLWHENIPHFSYVKKGNMLLDLAGSLYWWLKKFIDRKYFAAIDGIVALDNLTKQRREARGFRNVFVIRGGIDFQKFHAPVKDFGPKAARKEVGLFALGALNFVRRFDNIIEAVKYLRERGYNARANIVAKNVWHEDQYRDMLLALAKKYALEPFIKFHFEGLAEPELVKALQKSDVFVQAVYAPPPAHQGWGLVNFEAMAAGLPLVVVRSSSATEVLEDGKTALFFDPLRPEQIAEKVKFLVDHPEEYGRIARAGQAFVKENQSWRKYAEEFRRLCSEIGAR